MASLTISARWIFPVAGPPLADAAVTLCEDRIEALGKASATAESLGNVAILPGLVNAHTHLDLAAIERPLPTDGPNLAGWIRRVLQARAANPAALDLRLGVNELTGHGTTAVGDIVQPAASGPVELPFDAVRFLELIGPTPERAQAAADLAQAWLTADSPSATARLGLSPHAPYTVHPQLLDAAIRLSAAQRVPLAFHLAESPDELELLSRGTGPLRELLAERDAWTPDLVARGRRPLDYLHQLSAAERTLVIHGNYLNADEIAYLGQRRENMSVVYCPRTHARFEHPPYPLAQLLDAGCNVALGTDSRASTPDLSLWSELQTAARLHPQVSPAVLLSMATLGGAHALGLAAEQGTLAPGKLAQLTLVALPDCEGDPFELLFSAEARVIGRVWRGQRR